MARRSGLRTPTIETNAHMTVDSERPLIVLAGGSGDLGGRIARALAERGARVRALVRSQTTAVKRAELTAGGAEIRVVDDGDAGALSTACTGAACVVSALNGLEPAIIDVQGRLLDAAIAAGIPRCIPSDFCLDYTHTRPGDNRNMDVRRAFAARIERADIRATSILNGGFAELLTGDAPIVLPKIAKILYWGSADQALDFTTKDDVARYTAAAALDPAAPRYLRIAGTVVTPRSLAETMTALTGKRYGLLRAGGIGMLSGVITIAKAVAPQRGEVFPVWQGMQYMRDMSSGSGKLQPLDNDRYGAMHWTSARDVLAQISLSYGVMARIVLSPKSVT
jgi:nucleoside-diphosphate-sugar epimerase